MRYDILLYVLGALCLAGAVTSAVFYFKEPQSLQKAHGLPKEIVDMFNQWKQENNKMYTAEEEQYRMKIFYKNYKWTQKNSNDQVQFGINQFADLKKEEFASIYLGYKTHLKTDYSTCTATHVKSNDVATSVDWRTSGKVQKVKNQGGCGSCWAFSTVGSLESEDAIHGSGLGNFSEQQLVDCSTPYGNQGCNGGLMDQGFHYVMDNGIADESAYPYKGEDQDCQVEGGLFKIAKCTDVPAKDCDSLKSAIAQQPVSVAVDAMPWQFYIGGVFPKALCGQSLDHGVLAVGYDDKTQWIVKNSWGALWGEKGYIRLATGDTCGICNNASYPSITA